MPREFIQRQHEYHNNMLFFRWLFYLFIFFRCHFTSLPVSVPCHLYRHTFLQYTFIFFLPNRHIVYQEMYMSEIKFFRVFETIETLFFTHTAYMKTWEISRETQSIHISMLHYAWSFCLLQMPKEFFCLRLHLLFRVERIYIYFLFETWQRHWELLYRDMPVLLHSCHDESPCPACLPACHCHAFSHTEPLPLELFYIRGHVGEERRARHWVIFFSMPPQSL